MIFWNGVWELLMFLFLGFLRKAMGRNVWFQFLMMKAWKFNWDCFNVWFLKWGLEITSFSLFFLVLFWESNGLWYLISHFKYEWLHGNLAGVVVLYNIMKWGLKITFVCLFVCLFFFFLRKVMCRNIFFHFLKMNAWNELVGMTFEMGFGNYIFFFWVLF